MLQMIIQNAIALYKKFEFLAENANKATKANEVTNTTAVTTSLSSFKQEKYYFDKAVPQASVTLDNAWAAFFYYRMYTNF